MLEIKKMLSKLNIAHVLMFSLFIKILAFLILSKLNFPDTHTYIKAGKELFEFGQIKVNNVMPLHPIFVYITNSILSIKIANIALSILNVYLVYVLSLAIFNKKTISLISACIAGVYPFFIFYSITGLTETLYMTLVLSTFIFFYKSRFILASIFMVISILHRPTLDLLAPILVFLFAYYVHNYTIKKTIIKILQYLAIYMLLMFPWWIHQYNKYHEFVRLNLGDGLVWYSGNNPLNKSGGGVGGSSKGDDMDLTIFSHIKDPIARNNAMKKEAFLFIKNNPIQFLELSYKKFIRFWRLWPYAPEYESAKYIILSLLSYGIVLLLNIIFLIKYLRIYFIKVLPVLALFGYLTAVHMVLIGSIRYRLPLEPFMIIFASFSMVCIIQKYTKIKIS